MKFPLAAAFALAPVCVSNPVFAQDTTPQRIDGDRKLSLGLGIPKAFNFHGRIGLAVGLPLLEGRA